MYPRALLINTIASINLIAASLVVVLDVKLKSCLVKDYNAGMFVVCYHDWRLAQCYFSQPRRVHGLLKEYLDECNEHHDHPRHRMLLRDVLPVYERQEWSSHTLLDVYKRTIHALKVLERDHPSFIQPLVIAQHILSFDMKPDTWRKLQFIHIGLFPESNW